MREEVAGPFETLTPTTKLHGVTSQYTENLKNASIKLASSVICSGKPVIFQKNSGCAEMKA